MVVEQGAEAAEAAVLVLLLVHLVLLVVLAACPWVEAVAVSWERCKPDLPRNKLVEEVLSPNLNLPLQL